MEIVECPVCLKKCEMVSISDPFEGSKYDCPRCLKFAFDSLAEIYVPRFFRDREDARKALQAYIKNNQIEGKFLPLKWSKIGNILRQAGVNVEGLFRPNKDCKFRSIRPVIPDQSGHRSERSDAGWSLYFFMAGMSQG